MDSISNPQQTTWKKEWFLKVSNPSEHEMVVDVECEEIIQNGIVLAPRTTQYMMIGKNDLNCTARKR